MTLDYELNPSNLMSGYREHHKLRDQSHLYKYFTLIALIQFGIHLAFFRPFDHLHWLTLGILATAIWLQARIPFAIRAAIREQIKTNQIPVAIHMAATESEIVIATSKSNGAFLWDCLVDYKICETGILLYPQKSIFHWIPDTATIEGGTWQDFQALVSEKVTRKI